MPLNSVLIKDGHSQSGDDYVDVPALEEFLGSNSGEAVRLPNDVDLETVKLRLPSLKTILVDFPAFADGRGFPSRGNCARNMAMISCSLPKVRLFPTNMLLLYNVVLML